MESRRPILDAAIEIAADRGYEGTSVAAASAKCGLPAGSVGSIYWHFKVKDDLFAAVIERSFETRLAALVLPDEATGTPRQQIQAMAAHVAKSPVDEPDSSCAWASCSRWRGALRSRGDAWCSCRPGTSRGGRSRRWPRSRLPDLGDGDGDGDGDEDLHALTTYAIAGADGPTDCSSTGRSTGDQRGHGRSGGPLRTARAAGVRVRRTDDVNHVRGDTRGLCMTMRGDA